LKDFKECNKNLKDGSSNTQKYITDFFESKGSKRAKDDGDSDDDDEETKNNDGKHNEPPRKKAGVKGNVTFYTTLPAG
jgi:hypothetical protein